MAQKHLRPLRCEPRRQLLDDIYRAVLTAGAAHCHGQVAAGGGLVLRNPRLDEFAEIVDELRDAGLRLEKMRHRCIAACERAQGRLPVRVRERARIEHKVGIAWYAVLESERLDQHRHAITSPL